MLYPCTEGITNCGVECAGPSRLAFGLVYAHEMFRVCASYSEAATGTRAWILPLAYGTLHICSNPIGRWCQACGFVPLLSSLTQQSRANGAISGLQANLPAINLLVERYHWHPALLGVTDVPNWCPLFIRPVTRVHVHA